MASTYRHRWRQLTDTDGVGAVVAGLDHQLAALAACARLALSGGDLVRVGTLQNRQNHPCGHVMLRRHDDDLKCQRNSSIRM